MSDQTETRTGWLSRDDLANIRANVPLVYVDAVPVRVDELGRVTKVGMLLRQAADGTLSSLVYRQFFVRGFLRPFLWGHLRLVYDLSGGHYHEWFRGWHVGQLALLAMTVVGPKTMWGLIGVVPLATGLLNFCPAYTLLGINSCKTKA